MPTLGILVTFTVFGVPPNAKSALFRRHDRKSYAINNMAKPTKSTCARGDTDKSTQT
jgi:hypothetical protein